MPNLRASTKSKKNYQESEEENEDEIEGESEDEGVSKKSKKIKKTAKKKDTKKSTKDDKKKEATKGKKKTKKKDESDEEKVDEEEENPLLKKKGGKKQADSGKLKGYTAEQLKKYNELLEELNKHSINELKEMLRKNDQTMSGTKKELVQRVADGKVLGKIPRCPRCAGGRPKFDAKTGMYKCPGYRDDEDFKFCNKKYTMEELPREEWVD